MYSQNKTKMNWFFWKNEQKSEHNNRVYCDKNKSQTNLDVNVGIKKRCILQHDVVLRTVQSYGKKNVHIIFIFTNLYFNYLLSFIKQFFFSEYKYFLLI